MRKLRKPHAGSLAPGGIGRGRAHRRNGALGNPTLRQKLLCQVRAGEAEALIGQPLSFSLAPIFFVVISRVALMLTFCVLAC